MPSTIASDFMLAFVHLFIDSGWCWNDRANVFLSCTMCILCISCICFNTRSWQTNGHLSIANATLTHRISWA